MCYLIKEVVIIITTITIKLIATIINFIKLLAKIIVILIKFTIIYFHLKNQNYLYCLNLNFHCY